MSKAAAVRTDHLADIPLDRDGMFLRAERRHWADGTSCLHVAKWGTKDGVSRPWYPQQYMQVPWDLVGSVLSTLVTATPELWAELQIGLDAISDAESCFAAEQKERTCRL